MEGASVASPQGSLSTNQLRIDHDNYIHGLYKLCEAIHEYGSKASILLNHGGADSDGAETTSSLFLLPIFRQKQAEIYPRPLAIEEIHGIVQKFADAAKRAVTAGFDAVEIQAGHGYLLNQFLSPLTNDRTDEFGGSKENRARFTTLVLKAVREVVGENSSDLFKNQCR